METSYEKEEYTLSIVFKRRYGQALIKNVFTFNHMIYV